MQFYMLSFSNSVCSVVRSDPSYTLIRVSYSGFYRRSGKYFRYGGIRSYGASVRRKPSMPSSGLEEQIQVGDKVVLSSDSPTDNYGVVFEDDGTVGYLYGIEFSGENYNIVDAMHIYNVSSVIDRDQPSTIEIVWSEDGLKAALFINHYPHAVFDFAIHQGFCRTNFPSPSPNWKGHEWSDHALEGF